MAGNRELEMSAGTLFSASRVGTRLSGGGVPVLGGRKEVDPGTFVVGQIVAEGVGVGEGAAALPVFGGGLSVDD